MLIVGDSTAGKTRVAFEAMKVCLPEHVCVVPDGALMVGVKAALENRLSPGTAPNPTHIVTTEPVAEPITG